MELTMETQLTATNLDTLKLYAQGQLVELPEFAKGQPFVARLRRPSLLAMAKAGKIPNELLAGAQELFSEKSKGEKDSATIVAQMTDMFEAVCEASFVSPTYAEIKSAGIELTDDQKSFVFRYAQEGVKALNNFRQE